MAWTKYQLFLAGLLVVTGSINTLATKFADSVKSPGCAGGKFFYNGSLHPTEEPHYFAHPFLQATAMFMGEFSCLIVFKILVCVSQRKKLPGDNVMAIIQGNQEFSALIFYLPALCDLVATSLMYVGLIMTYPASFQMFRGSVIIFTGLLTMCCLKRHLPPYKWVGMVVVLLGLLILGVIDMRTTAEGQYTTRGIIIGDVLIVSAQIITATQMVIEEKFITQHNVPALQVVGWEGLYGMCTLGILLIPMYFIKVNGVPFEDSLDAICQVAHSSSVALGFFGTLVSIAFFNFAGISVTQQLSATTRVVLDSIRTIIIWGVSIAMGTQKFQPLAIVGFLVLLLGMFIFNNVLIVPFMVRRGWIKDTEPTWVVHPQISDEKPVVNTPDPAAAVSKLSTASEVKNSASEVKTSASQVKTSTSQVKTSTSGGKTSTSEVISSAPKTKPLDAETHPIEVKGPVSGINSLSQAAKTSKSQIKSSAHTPNTKSAAQSVKTSSVGAASGKNSTTANRPT